MRGTSRASLGRPLFLLQTITRFNRHITRFNRHISRFNRHITRLNRKYNQTRLSGAVPQPLFLLGLWLKLTNIEFHFCSGFHWYFAVELGPVPLLWFTPGWIVSKYIQDMTSKYVIKAKIVECVCTVSGTRV